MKKYLILIILFFLFLCVPVAVKSSVSAAGESCNITPAQINTDGTTYAQATLTTQNYGATSPTWYAKLVKAVQQPDGTTTYFNFERKTASRTLGDNDPNHDYFVVPYGPFNAGDEGNYTIYFNLSADVGTGSYATSCQFAVQSTTPPSGIACPTFDSMEPPETLITSSSNILLKYQKNNASTIDAYKVEIFDSNNVLVKPVALTDQGSIWTATVGPLSGPEAVYSARLTHIAANYVCKSTPISVLDSRDTTFGSGRNPCSATSCPTAFGDIDTDITKFAGKFLSIAIGVAGGIALILLVFGSIRVLTSSGNQQTLAAGRDTIIAAIAGLLFLIFSVLILRALGIIVGIQFP